MHIAMSGWFAGRSVGSGQYTDHLVAALRASAPAGERLDLVESPDRSTRAKLAFEQWGFPRAARSADLAHVPYWAPPLHPSVPTIVTVHDLIPLVLPEYRARRAVRAYTALVARATRSAAAILADSEHTAADIRAWLEVEPGRVVVVALGVDGWAGPLLPTPSRAGPSPNLPLRYGLYLGGFDLRKNLQVLLAAWRDVYRATGVPLVIAGRPPDAGDPLFPHPAEIARRVALPAEALRLIGFVEEADKPALLAGAAVFAFPSRYEGFGLPPLEAMACGTPVVAAEATSLPEVVGDAGILVHPDDTAGWGDAIRAVLEDEALAARLRAAGPRRAAAFTWQATAEGTRAVYRQVQELGVPS